MKKGLRLSILAAVLVAGSIPLLAEPGNFGVNGSSAWNQPAVKRVEHTDRFGDTYYTYKRQNAKKSLQKEVEHHTKKFKPAPQEVMNGFNETLAALKSLDSNDLSAAKKHLRKATKLFDEALKKSKIKDIPIDQDIEIYRFEGSVNDIKADLTLAKSLLESHQTQAAREVLEPLRDEIDVTVHYIPMDLFPKSTKNALDYLEKGDKDEAVSALLAGMDTVVAYEVVIPVPLLSAQELVNVASDVAKKDPKAAREHLRLAREELQKALLLGYTDKHRKEYKRIYEEIAKVRKEIKMGHNTGSLFEKLKKDIESLLHRTRETKRELSDSGSVWKGTAKAHAAAAKEESEDRLRFEEKKESNDF